MNADRQEQDGQDGQDESRERHQEARTILILRLFGNVSTLWFPSACICVNLRSSAVPLLFRPGSSAGLRNQHEEVNVRVDVHVNGRRLGADLDLRVSERLVLQDGQGPITAHRAPEEKLRLRTERLYTHRQ